MYVHHVSSSLSLNNPLIRPRKVLHMFHGPNSMETTTSSKDLTTPIDIQTPSEDRFLNPKTTPYTPYTSPNRKNTTQTFKPPINTVDGRNPAPVDVMYRYPSIHGGFIHPRWCRISYIKYWCTLISWGSAFRGSKLTPPHVRYDWRMATGCLGIV